MFQGKKKEEIEKQESGQEDSFQFVQEKIKERPINKKRLFRRTVITAALALVFGMVACVTFFWMEPIISNWLYPEEKPEIVTFPEEEIETLPEDIIQTEEEEREATEEVENEAGTGQPSTITIYEKIGLTAEDYVALYSELSEIADEAKRSMVKVTGINSDVDWFNELYDNEGQSAGVIVANNGVELLILAKENAIRGYGSIFVTFDDGSINEAVLKQTDAGTGLSILGVDLDHISEDTMNAINIASLGSSNMSSSVGQPVIAIGAPNGNIGSVSYGIITSNSTVVRKQDINYRLLTTDIYGSVEATGVLINLKGQVLGIIDNSYNASGMQNQISALGITELKRTIEALSNERERAYLGVYGTDITVAISESLGMPRGVYVERFEIGSPAMICGIQSSDIITGIEDSPVNSVADLASLLARYKPGDIVTLTLQREVQEEYREMEIEVMLGTLK